MKLKKLLLTITLLVFSLVLAACGGTDDNEEAETPSDEGSEKVTLKVAALESAYGAEMWDKIADAYEAVNENVTVELTVEKNLEEVVRPNLQAGEYPDIFLLATGREEGLTDTLIKENGLEEITDVLGMTVAGEDVTVEEKLLDGFTDTLATNPYADGKTYLAPMFYSPTGLFYNANLLEEKGWETPATWDAMFALGDKAKGEDTALFTYPVAGYFDSLIPSLMYAAGGPDFYHSAMTYEDGIWETEEAKQVLETIANLGDYTHPNTVANANPNDFTKNQQMILDNEALFMPNGTWVVGEMAEAPREEGFEWGMMPAPAFGEEGDRYAFTFFEQMWIPKQAENKDAAKEFLTFMYSDKAASIFLEAGAVQPINGITDQLEDDKKLFYSIYDEQGALPAMGGFASTEPVPGVNMHDTLYKSIDGVIAGSVSLEEWQSNIEETSDKLRDTMN
ncbi:carbohydrate ABC transporter substrate-binding protein [Paraliobacillus sp. JSM ZJ581]|uniref:carbohydrate ABC transporter substrate-binding protein n=1 Tax=Paraliobacillus sp. JSM ZJ581 TaxID=3342118 RepID=UPI0035A83D70